MKANRKTSHIKSLNDSVKILPGIFYIKDRDYVYQGASEYFAKKLSYNNPSYVLGKTDYDFSGEHQENAPMFRNQDKLVLQGQEIKSLYIQRYPNDKKRVVHFNSKKPYFYKNQIIGVFGNTYEIDEQHLRTFIEHGLICKESCLNTVDVSVYSIAKQCHDLLSSRESLCLFYLMRGQTAKQIANQMNISPKTVESYIDRKKKKFDCLNKSQLIEKAYNLKLNLFIPESLVKSIA